MNDTSNKVKKSGVMCVQQSYYGSHMAAEMIQPTLIRADALGSQGHLRDKLPSGQLALPDHDMNSASLFVLLCAVALLVGALIPIQAATNAALSKSIESVFYASLVLFIVGLLFIVVFLAVQGMPPPTLDAFQSAPKYAYLGGFIVATYVISITYLAPRIGVGNAICFIVTGQIVSAVIIDHYGLFGALIHQMDWRRILGILLMITGLFLARRV